MARARPAWPSGPKAHPAEAQAQEMVEEMVEEMPPRLFLLDFPLFGRATPPSRAELAVVEQAPPTSQGIRVWMRDIYRSGWMDG